METAEEEKWMTEDEEFFNISKNFLIELTKQLNYSDEEIYVVLNKFRFSLKRSIAEAIKWFLCADKTINNASGKLKKEDRRKLRLQIVEDDEFFKISKKRFVEIAHDQGLSNREAELYWKVALENLEMFNNLFVDFQIRGMRRIYEFRDGHIIDD